jgi:hypothetical protein
MEALPIWETGLEAKLPNLQNDASGVSERGKDAKKRY